MNLLSCFIIFFGLSAQAFDPSGFSKASFVEKDNEFSGQCNTKDKGVGLDVKMHPFYASVKYIGKIQNIHSSRKGLISLLSKSIGQKFDEMYKKEIAVEESGKEIWLPAQDAFLQTFLPVAKKDSMIDVYVRHAGCGLIDKKTEHVYLLITSPKL